MFYSPLTNLFLQFYYSRWMEAVQTDFHVRFSVMFHQVADKSHKRLLNSNSTCSVMENISVSCKPMKSLRNVIFSAVLLWSIISDDLSDLPNMSCTQDKEQSRLGDQETYRLLSVWYHFMLHHLLIGFDRCASLMPVDSDHDFWNPKKYTLKVLVSKIMSEQSKITLFTSIVWYFLSCFYAQSVLFW